MRTTEQKQKRRIQDRKYREGLTPAQREERNKKAREYNLLHPGRTTEQSRRWVAKNKARYNKYQKNHRRTTRLKAYEILGGCCVHCGETDPVLLDIDHIYGNGNLRKNRNSDQEVVSGRINREQLQLLCVRCHRLKTRTNGDHLRSNSTHSEQPESHDAGQMTLF